MRPSPTVEELKAISVWNAEDWMYDDFQVGNRIKSIRRTISEGESMAFNALVLDMHPYVADEIFARHEGVFGRRLVAGLLCSLPVWGLWPPIVSTRSATAMTS